MKPYFRWMLIAFVGAVSHAQDSATISGGIAAQSFDTGNHRGSESTNLKGVRALLPVDRDLESQAITTLDESIVRSEHFAMQSFSHEVANGEYLVNLYFAETYQQISGPGQRVFSFNVNGVDFQNFDIWKMAGGFNRVYVESVPVVIESGRLLVTFAARIENAAIKAIEIIPQSESARPDETIRINAGGSTPSLDSAGRTWLSDQGFVGGRVNSGGNQFGYGGSSLTSNQPLYLFMNYDVDNNGLSATELPQGLRFIHPRLDEDENGELDPYEMEGLDAFILRESDGAELKDALLDDDALSAETIVRLRQALDSFEAEVSELDANVASEFNAAKRAEWGSYLFTVAAMLIAVLSFGHLLTANPPRRQRWTHIDASPDALRSVIESLVLISLLSAVDLLWTTFKSAEIHFHEMNPVGNSLLQEGGSLMAFKVISLMSAIGLLFFLRKFKGAQLASWWGCMICTLVTFRWIVLDSAILS